MGELLQVGVRAGQLARLPGELLLGRLLLGDVASDGVDQATLDHRRGPPGEPAVFAVTGPVAILEIDGDLAAGQVRHLRERALPIVRMNELDELAREQLLGVVAENPLEGGIDPPEEAVEIGDAHEI